jgi:hypothetical protein
LEGEQDARSARARRTLYRANVLIARPSSARITQVHPILVSLHRVNVDGKPYPVPPLIDAPLCGNPKDAYQVHPRIHPSRVGLSGRVRNRQSGGVCIDNGIAERMIRTNLGQTPGELLRGG